MALIKSALAVTTLFGALLAAYPAAAQTPAPTLAKVPAPPVDPHLATGAKLSPARQLAELAETYYEAKVRFDPVGATITGDNRFDDQLTMLIRADVRARHFAELHEVLGQLQGIDRRALTDAERITYDCLAWEVNATLGLESFPDHLLPINQMDSMPVVLANFAGGQGSQPIATVAQYRAFLKRVGQLPEWVDVAIANMRMGIKTGVVQPRALIVAALPQLKALAGASVEGSDFYASIKLLPASFTDAEKHQLTAAYREMVGQKLLPALRKLATFVEADYLPATRSTAGWGALPNGAAWYRAWSAWQTTTDLSPQEIHAIGLKEMARIDAEFVKLAPKLGYSGPPAGIGKWLAAQPQYRPFKKDQEVLDAYRALNNRIEQGLPTLFATLPKAKLAIRPEPELTRDSASDHYEAASADATRPGTFWAVIIDPRDYATTQMTALFLHEGQPGHHFQISKQQELDIPKFRKFSANNAYVEGWALYAETLGRELGLYDDPNAYAGFLMMDQRRAARLVVDTGLHALGWSREQTIAFLVARAGDSEDSARNATERYMAWPGQALGYKMGALKILALRQQAAAALGPKFNLAKFHDEILSDGAVPLSLLDQKIAAWIARQR